MKLKLVLSAWCLVLGVGAAFGSAEMMQQISLVRGWNSVHVQVAETNDVDALFRDWPVEWVALYDPAAFLETRQYSAESSNEGASRAGYRMWRRSEPGLSQFRYVPADSVLVCFVTNGEHKCAFYGEPRAPRITWHKSDVDENLNLVGFSTTGETTAERYFSGLSVGDASFFVFGGDNADKPMVMPTTLVGATAFVNGQVLAVSSPKISDWSGVLNVSPRNGLAFGADATRGTLEIRNDGATNAVVAVRMSAESPRFAGDIDPVPQGLFVRDAVDAATNGPWTAFTTETTLRRELGAGETWRIAFAIDLLQLVEGTQYGAILSIRDETPGGSAMRVNVPLAAAREGASSDYAWPKGVWSAAADLDTVNFMVTSEDNGTFRKTDEGMKRSGGRMTVRLPLYVDENGKMTLLQRLWFGRNTNGVLRAFSGAVETSEESLSDVQRLSTPFLPTDQPEIAFTENSTFGRSALVSFTVGEKSNVNPMRHAQHPQHDGLTADYGSAAPSGDNFNNYIGLVKPETFSISNRVSFVWDESGATRWNPEETLRGTLTWEFDGLRHEGTVRAKGRFAMKRLSPVTVKMK